MKTLIITRHYLDEQLGGPNCSKAFVRAVAEIFPDCSLIFPEHDDHYTDLHFLLHTNLRLLPWPDKRSRVQKGLDMYRGKIHRFGSAKEEMRRGAYDIVFIDHSLTAADGIIEAARRYAGRVVTLHHNVERQYIKDNPQSALFRLPYNHFALRAERKAVMMSHLNIVLTDDDARTFAADYPEKAASLRTLGMFLFDDRPQMALSQERENVFVISGSLGSSQTETSLMNFFASCLPVLNRACPDNRIIITGRNPSAKLEAECRRHTNIELVPNPADLLAEIRRARYYIAPIDNGGGLKLRVMDGLRLGLPVLAHIMATRGYEPILADGCMFGYSDPASFERSLRSMLAGEWGSPERVVESFLSHFSFAAGKRRLEEILNSLK